MNATAYGISKTGVSIQVAVKMLKGTVQKSLRDGCSGLLCLLGGRSAASCLPSVKVNKEHAADKVMSKEDNPGEQTPSSSSLFVQLLLTSELQFDTDSGQENKPETSHFPFCSRHSHLASTLG